MCATCVLINIFISYRSISMILSQFLKIVIVNSTLISLSQGMKLLYIYIVIQILGTKEIKILSLDSNFRDNIDSISI